jgi:hypothetical protein
MHEGMLRLLDCQCAQGGLPYWESAMHRVTDEQREEAEEYAACVEAFHKGAPSKDRGFGTPEQNHRRLIQSRVAETAAASILHATAAPCQKKGRRGLVYAADLGGDVGVRWTGVRPPVLFFKALRYARDEVTAKVDYAKLERVQPLDEIEILAVGDLHEIHLLGWQTMRMVSSSYDFGSEFFVEKWDNWAVPVKFLHRLPIYPKQKGLLPNHRSVPLSVVG